ncbi:sugar ABC transporter ATP-binding protein [Geobacillus thermodenitrificans]|jgi:simple sugar transport system ATP-binding protein|uniref:sugar ABC transporter ATP-binding protein n=1 Tax=Geobacillus thermodenitrificans TaxID=33940 RepID=UPI0004A431ED|nr:sugar ABC transporter ATP-binding protein [Geobacillus thermodenitrificans]ARA97383.1 sugar ABC transporter [Geobacillus thermodenitrificans]MED3906160.1 sugar ABC transporter ATP-binding protein [Geobacillus thermodenitrificans]
MSGLSMKAIEKAFGTVRVLNGVNFDVRPGEVHALLGMNGAGKSTLMNILAGAILPDAGTITIDGTPCAFSSPREAKQAGIGLVVQEVDTALFPGLPIYENLAADELADVKHHPIRSLREEKKWAAALLHRVGLSIPPTKLVRDCSLHEKQLIVLAKVLSSNARYIILDEPTAALSEAETKRLFAIIHELKQQGVGFIYISHKLKEVQEIADRLTILRDGRIVYQGAAGSLSLEDIVLHMTGTKQAATAKQARTYGSEIAFAARGIKIDKTSTTVDIYAHRGEIVGIAGLVGAGKTELAESLVAHRKTSGEWQLDGQHYTFSSPYEAIAAGLCLIPEERRKQGLFLPESVQTNLTVRLLSWLSRWQWISRMKETDAANGLVRSLGIHPPSPSTAVRHLSGGNQQKVVIGKWLNTNARVFLFDEPTKGIDVHAKQDVFSIIRTLADEGKTVLYFSSEFRELLEVCDTIYIMVDGRLLARLPAAELTYEQLVYYCSGGEIDGPAGRFRDTVEKSGVVYS